MGALTVEVLANRKQLEPETPFAEYLDYLADAVVALTRLADAVDIEPAEFLEEFALREEEEQTQFGVKVAVAALTLQTLVQSVAGGVGGAFEANKA